MRATNTNRISIPKQAQGENQPEFVTPLYVCLCKYVYRGAHRWVFFWYSLNLILLLLVGYLSLVQLTEFLKQWEDI